MSYVTGTIIKRLREKASMTQKELAEKINVSDKAVSKWETGNGFPDIGIIEELAKVLNVSLTELFTGDLRTNENHAGNMKKVQFYVCPICGNVITALGQGSYSCCGVHLPMQEAEKAEDNHTFIVNVVDEEYHVTMDHTMEKGHYISFVAYVTSGSAEIVKLYPEQDISVRFRKKGHGFLYSYCNRHGLYRQTI